MNNLLDVNIFDRRDVMGKLNNIDWFKESDSNLFYPAYTKEELSDHKKNSPSVNDKSESMLLQSSLNSPFTLNKNQKVMEQEKIWAN